MTVAGQGDAQLLQTTERAAVEGAEPRHAELARQRREDDLDLVGDLGGPRCALAGEDG
jgi:hypothetical protein